MLSQLFRYCHHRCYEAPDIQNGITADIAIIEFSVSGFCGSWLHSLGEPLFVELDAQGARIARAAKPNRYLRKLAQCTNLYGAHPQNCVVQIRPHFELYRLAAVPRGPLACGQFWA